MVLSSLSFSFSFSLIEKTPLLTVHLALFGENDLAAAARRIDGHRLQEALLDVGAPDAFSGLLAVLVVRARLTAGLGAAVGRVRDGEVVAVGVGCGRAADAGVTAAAERRCPASVADARGARRPADGRPTGGRRRVAAVHCRRRHRDQRPAKTARQTAALKLSA